MPAPSPSCQLFGWAGTTRLFFWMINKWRSTSSSETASWSKLWWRICWMLVQVAVQASMFVLRVWSAYSMKVFKRSAVIRNLVYKGMVQVAQLKLY
mmetsp:Transcript_17840/g.34539  ORF Transcript_17840/g.34539 Transcript_17840/m.34539 type:complete len:96 (+) Transcript_17840:206-493(+)